MPGTDESLNETMPELVPDEREGKLPRWVRGTLYALRRDVRWAADDKVKLQAENERLRDLVDSKYKGEHADADTFFVDEDTAKELSLGKGPEIRFADFYSARYAAVDRGVASTGGVRVLIIETDADMQVRPVGSRAIIIARA